MILREKTTVKWSRSERGRCRHIAFATRRFGTEGFGTSGSYQMFRHKTFRQMPGTKKKFQKKKKSFRPTDPNFFGHVTGNRLFFFLALSADLRGKEALILTITKGLPCGF